MMKLHYCVALILLLHSGQSNSLPGNGGSRSTDDKDKILERQKESSRPVTTENSRRLYALVPIEDKSTIRTPSSDDNLDSEPVLLPLFHSDELEDVSEPSALILVGLRVRSNSYASNIGSRLTANDKLNRELSQAIKEDEQSGRTLSNKSNDNSNANSTSSTQSASTTSSIPADLETQVDLTSHLSTVAPKDSSTLYIRPTRLPHKAGSRYKFYRKLKQKRLALLITRSNMVELSDSIEGALS